jgi:hypothetical protein
VSIEPQQPEWFRHHSSVISGAGMNWVAASGAKGLRSLKVKLAGPDSKTRRYTVRLHFVEPDDLHVGDRLFDVAIQGHPMVRSLDVIKEAGGRNRSLMKESNGIEASDDLLIELTPHPHAKVQATVLCGIEIQPEGW